MREKRNIVWVVIDTLRADMCFGEGRAVETPTIDSLVEGGTSFTQALAVGSVTTATVATMLTGLYPFLHGVIANLFREGGNPTPAALNPRCVTLPEVLKKDGYYTCAMVTGPLSPYYKLDRGFDDYIQRGPRETIYTRWGEDLKETIRKKKWREPWFLFLHLWEVHLPRTVLRPFRSARYGPTRYEKALSCLDHHLKDFFDLLDFDETILLLHGDHGENYHYPPPILRPLYTRIGMALAGRFRIMPKLKYLRRTFMGPRLPDSGLDWISHGNFLYDFLVRVPLIAVGNGIFPGGKMIDAQISQADIMPTILDAVGLSRSLNQRIHGRSLMPLVRGEPLPERPVLLQTGRRVAIRTPGWKLIVNRSEFDTMELYDLRQDPTEDNDLIGADEEIAKTLRRQLDEILSLEFEELSSKPQEITGEEREILEKNLRALGYL